MLCSLDFQLCFSGPQALEQLDKLFNEEVKEEPGASSGSKPRTGAGRCIKHAMVLYSYK